MANPQPDRYTRISNELYIAIMMTDFSKRQRKILDLIMRCSYGCGKKSAVLKPSDYEVVGLYKTHITKELIYLEKANVITIDRDTYETVLNKDYDSWRVSLAKTADMEKFNEILKRNLEHKKETCGQSCGYPVDNDVDKSTGNNCSYQNSNQEVTKTVTGGYQNSNSEVTETVTERAGNPSDDANFPSPKEIIKEIYKDIFKENKKDSFLLTEEQLIDKVKDHYNCGYGDAVLKIYTKIMHRYDCSMQKARKMLFRGG